jgi:lysophospholipase L1-like esterase
MARSRPPDRPVWKKCLYSAIWVTLIFGTLEVRQRVIDAHQWNDRNADPYSLSLETASGCQYDHFQRGRLSIESAPFLVYRNRPDQSSPVLTINAQGFRGGDWKLAKEPDALRVVFLGGSTAFGYQVSRDDRVYSAVLERLLRESPALAGRRVEVWNAGVVGYCSAQELVLLATKLVDYRPDLVVLLDGYNDFNYGRLVLPGTKEILPPLFYDVDQRVADGARPWLVAMRASAFFRRLEEIGRHRREPVSPFHRTFDNVAVAAAQYRGNLEKIARVARAYGVKVVLAPQPELFHRRGRIPDEERKLRAKLDAWGYGRIATEQYGTYVEQAAAVAREQSLAFVDTRPAFDARDEAVFTDAAHLSDRGNELLAQFLLPALIDALRGP